MATGLYLQCGQLLTEVLLYGLPLTFTGFNLFLVYGTPGPEAAPGSGTLAARVEPATGALIFTINNVLTIIGLALILIFPAASLPWRFGLWPLLILAVINQELVKRKAYRDERRLNAAGPADVNAAPGHGPGVRVDAVAAALMRVLGSGF